MKRIAYADTVIGTDPVVADLVMRYATELARTGGADTVTIPARADDGGVQRVSLLLGPASQITVFEDDEPFEADATAARDDLRRRLESLTGAISQSDAIGPDAIDDLDDLDDRL